MLCNACPTSTATLDISAWSLFLAPDDEAQDVLELSGNTGLHYCYAYGFKEIGDYLKTRGANDGLLNVDGLTCYEGLSNDSLNVEG